MKKMCVCVCVSSSHSHPPLLQRFPGCRTRSPAVSSLVVFVVVWLQPPALQPGGASRPCPVSPIPHRGRGETVITGCESEEPLIIEIHQRAAANWERSSPGSTLGGAWFLWNTEASPHQSQAPLMNWSVLLSLLCPSVRTQRSHSPVGPVHRFVYAGTKRVLVETKGPFGVQRWCWRRSLAGSHWSWLMGSDLKPRTS